MENEEMLEVTQANEVLEVTEADATAAVESEEVQGTPDTTENEDAHTTPDTVLTSSADVNLFEDVYKDTLYFVDGMVDQYDFYPEIIDSLGSGNAKMELKKRYMIKAIDEEWVSRIEDCIPALDEVIRTPSRFIEETEKVLPIELSRNISRRSIQHLSQHTDYISKVEDDNTIIPSKILNVFRDETNKTYENKFINTLINRLFLFVERRYETALKEGKDEKNTSLDYTQNFTHGEAQGKIHFRIELAEDPRDGEEMKNYTYTTDLWHRVVRLHHICRAYINSSFVKSMENQFIRPPVIRTNPILKNKNLRQCLELWEFIESYENIGYDMLVHESLETLDAEYIKEIYSMSALQYLIFRYNIKNEFEADKTLAESQSHPVLSPEIKEELTPAESSEFDKIYEKTIRVAQTNVGGKQKRSCRDKAMLRAVDVALISDEMIRKLKLRPNPSYRNLKPEWFKKVEKTVGRVHVTAQKVGEDIKETTVNVAKTTANGVKTAAIAVATTAKRGWDSSTQKVEDFCRTHPQELEQFADVMADVALKTALVGAFVIFKEQEKGRRR
jgi:hypothetical protein